MASNNKQYGVKSAAEYLGVTTQQVQKLFRTGKVKAEKVPVEDTDIVTWKTTAAALDAYKANHSAASGAKKFIVFLTVEQLEEVEDLLAEHGVTLTPAAKVKTDEQRAKAEARRAAKKAAKVPAPEPEPEPEVEATA